MYLSGGHKTVKNILKRGAFTVSMGDAEHAAACDYVGIESGRSSCRQETSSTAKVIAVCITLFIIVLSFICSSY